MSRPSFAAFAWSFVPFALALTAANLAAETSRDLPLYRAVYSIWVCMALALPALLLAALYDLRRAPPAVYNVWRLFWTFSYLAYLAHFYFAVWGFFGGDVAQIFRRQTPLVAGTNFALTGLWGVELVGVWLGLGRVSTAFYAYQCAVHLLALAAIFVSAVVFKSGFVWWLGLVVVGLTALALVARLLFGSAAPEPAPAAG